MEGVLIALAESYFHFTADHPELWIALFEHRLPPDHVLPAWYHGKIGRLLAMVEESLAPMFGPDEQDQRVQAARVLWCAVHGICSLAGSGKLGLVTADSVAAMADALVVNHVAGLRHWMAQAAPAIRA
ncbi:MAG: TetR-like C-terminal domain-containing protein [Alphaproteobacteria bacterium]